MDFHRSIELGLAIGFAEFGPAIKTDRQLRFRNLSSLCEWHGVHAGHKARPPCASESNLRSWRHARRFCAHRPGHTIQAGTFAGWQFINDAAGSVQHFQFQSSKKMALAL